MMSEDDKEVFKQARPYVVGLVALVYDLRREQPPEESFDDAERFVALFEKRHGIEPAKETK